MTDLSLMRRYEVAALLRVDPQTVTKMADDGLLHTVRPETNSHRRYQRSQVERLAAHPAGPRLAAWAEKRARDGLLTVEEVAAIFRVGRTTVSKWGTADPPLLEPVTTSDGRCCYRRQQVFDLLARPAAN